MKYTLIYNWHWSHNVNMYGYVESIIHNHYNQFIYTQLIKMFGDAPDYGSHLECVPLTNPLNAPVVPPYTIHASSGLPLQSHWPIITPQVSLDNIYHGVTMFIKEFIHHLLYAVELIKLLHSHLCYNYLYTPLVYRPG